MSKPTSLLAKLKAFFTSLIPVQRRTVYDSRTSPLSLASQLDVDTILTIMKEAEQCDVTRLFALYRDIIAADNHLQTEFSKRLLAVLGDVLTVQPADEKNAEDVKAAEAVREMVKVPSWTEACARLLTSTLWPVSLVEKVFAPVAGGYKLAALVPVPFELLDFTLGRLRIRGTDPVTGLITGEYLEPDESRYIVHRGHLLPTPDYWGGPFRSLVFWWYFAALDRDAWARFLERFGAPFLVGKYDQADDASRGILESAFSQATKLFGIVISRETEVEIQQASTAPTGEAFEKFHATANKEKSKLILGQTMSAEAQSTGIGQGASPQQESVRQDIRQFDAAGLSTALHDQLVVQFLRINGLAGDVKLVWGGESPEQAAALGELLAQLNQAGLQVTDEGLVTLSEKLGMPIERIAPPPAPVMIGPPGHGAPPFPAALSAGYLALHAADPLSPSVLDRMAGDGSAALARKFRAVFAPLRARIAAAESAEEVLAAVNHFSVGWDATQRAALLTEALTTFALNGAVHVAG